MIDLNTTNEWQHRDESGMILPWYTKSFLDELVTWDLKDKVVFEYGAGASTLWWSGKAYKVYGVESNFDWYSQVIEAEIGNARISWGDEQEFYERSAVKWRRQFDIIVIDGDPVEWRDGCVKSAIANLKPGGRLIIDNWDQPSVWVPSDETRKMLADWPVKIYPQEGHKDWATALFIKP